jgi:hypothetical protein
MYDIPLNLQRRFEQRWTARFLSWNWPRPKRTGIKPILAKTKRKPAGLKRRARGLHRRCERGPEPAPLSLSAAGPIFGIRERPHGLAAQPSTQAQKSRRSGSGCGGSFLLSLSVTSKVKIMMLARG